MILGYNKPRPTKDDYRNFESKLVNGLKDLSIEGLSLMFYGSYVRGDYNPGRSDIDGVMIFPDDVIINKENLFLCSKILSESLKNSHIPFQVTVCDKTTMKDGRFNSYTAEYRDYFNDEAKIVVGPDLRNEINAEKTKSGDLHSVSFNLRKSRTGLLFSDYYLSINDYEHFLYGFNKALDAASRSSKQILYLMDGSLRKNRFSALKTIKETMPEINIEPLEKIKYCYNNPSKLDKIYKDSNEVIKLWQLSLTTFEQIIKGFISRYPK